MTDVAVKVELGELSSLAVSLPIRTHVQTADVGAAHEVLSRLYAEHVPRLSGDRERFRFETRSTQTDLIGIDWGRHTMTVATEADPYRSLYVIRVLGGWLQLDAGSSTFCATAGDVLVCGTDTAHQVQWSALRWQAVRLDIAATFGLVAGLLDADRREQRFALGRPVSEARLRYWQAAVDHVSGAVFEVPAVASSALARAEAFRMLAGATLLTFPNSALAATADPNGRGTGAVEPAVLRRAMAFVEAHADQPIGLAQIAAAARVGARSLQQAFRRYRDTTPLEYVRTVRMERARADLLAADPAAGDTVAAVAARWGFTHYGHFAVDYRRRFGCSPSATLRG